MDIKSSERLVSLGIKCNNYGCDRCVGVIPFVIYDVKVTPMKDGAYRPKPFVPSQLSHMRHL